MKYGIILLLLVPTTTITKTTIEIAKTNAKNNCNDYYNNRRALHEQMGCWETIKHNAPGTRLVGFMVRLQWNSPDPRWAYVD